MITSTARPTSNSPCSITREIYSGWNAIGLGNGLFKLFIVPEIGGRVIQLRLGAQDCFYVNPRHLGRVYSPEQNNFDSGWKNYGGSKVWPAPQGWSSDAEWPGPPDPVLDGGAYSCRILDDKSETAAVLLESPADDYTGLTFARELRIFQDTTTVHIRHTMRNTAARPVRWGIWQVTQHAVNGDIAVFTRARTYRQMLGDQAYASIRLDPETKLWRLRYADQVAKFAVRPEDGWVATLDSQRRIAHVETFQLFTGVPYPDGAPLELWVNGRGSYTIHGDRMETQKDPNGCDPFLETEVLSPLAELQPGQEYTFHSAWHCTAIDADAVLRVADCGAVARALEVQRRENQLRVTGSFGLFHAAIAELVGTYRAGKEKAHVLGAATPLVPCVVDQLFPYEDGLSQISLRLRRPDGKLLGTVDHATVC